MCGVFCFVCLFVITAGYIRVGVLSVWMILWRSGIPGLSSARELITSNKSHTIAIKTCSHSCACNVSSLIAVVCGFGCILGDAGELPVRLGAREVPTPTHPASNHPRIHPIVHPSIHPSWSSVISMAAVPHLEAVKKKIKSLQELIDETQNKSARLQAELEAERAARASVRPREEAAPLNPFKAH